MLALTEKGRTPGEGSPLASLARQFTSPALIERMGVSPVATGDQRRRLWKPRALKSSTKLFMLGAVR